MAGYCTLVLYFHSPAACENTAAHSCNIQPYYLLTHQIIYIYLMQVELPSLVVGWVVGGVSVSVVKVPLQAVAAKSFPL